MPDTDTILIPPDRANLADRFIADSSLGGCTETTNRDGCLVVTLRWPSISDGEAQLWDLLASIAGQSPRICLADVARWLDARNRAAVARAVEALLMVRAGRCSCGHASCSDAAVMR